jgi:hypothetical protein
MLALDDAERLYQMPGLHIGEGDDRDLALHRRRQGRRQAVRSRPADEQTVEGGERHRIAGAAADQRFHQLSQGRAPRNIDQPAEARR